MSKQHYTFLNVLACAKAHGASRIIIADISEGKLPLADRHGTQKARHLPPRSPAEATQQLIALLPPLPSDL